MLHQVRLRVITDDKPGILAHVSSTFENHELNISEASCRVRDDGSAISTFRFGVRDLDSLDKLSSKLRGVPGRLAGRSSLARSDQLELRTWIC